MNTFLFAINAVLPVVLPALLGWFLRRVGLLTERFLAVGNKLTFRVLIPVLLFHNIYNIGSMSEIDLTYVLYAVGGTVLLTLIAVPVTSIFFKKNGQRSVLIQAVFRSNYAIIGIPLATSLAGAAGAAAATVMSAFTIAVYNVLAVVILTVISDGREQKEGIPWGKLALGVAKNPLIIGIVCGLVVLGMRAVAQKIGVTFRFSDISFLSKTVRDLAGCCTPFALLVLGGRFTFTAIPALKKQILCGTLLRCVAVPALMLPVAYLLMPDLGAGCYAALIAAFGSPAAVSSAVMAKEMGADGELADQLVVWSTLLSVFTVFLTVAIFRAIGVF